MFCVIKGRVAVKSLAYISVVLLLGLFIGCETVHDTTKKGGEYIGKGARAVGGISEGAVDGYMGEESPEENPYNR